MHGLPLLLPGESVQYPHDTYHQYLKLFTHAYDFGRFDLATLIIEWLCYLIFTAFVVCKADGVFANWDWFTVFVPLFIALGLGTMRSICCGKRSRCAVSARAVYTTIGLFLSLFLLLKIRGSTNWSWDAVFSPLYILFGVSMFLFFCGCLWSVWLVYHDRLLKLQLMLGLVVFVLSTIFTHFLATKLDYFVDGIEDTLSAQWSWWVVFSPIWIIHIILFISSAAFAAVFPNQEFIEDKIIGGSGTKTALPSIKPRYRGHFMFVLASIFNIPLSIFSVMCCLYLQKLEATGQAPYLVAVMFAPFFVFEIVALCVIMALIHARRLRGSYCIKIDNGIGAPPTEIW